MSASDKPKVIVIVGPTASGKTSLSISIAKQYGGEVISADSRQVYKGMDIGSGKVTEEEMDRVPHHLLDVVSPNTIYTVADFVRDGTEAIRDITQRGRLPVIAGGTFFYIDALLGISSIPHVAPNSSFRESVQDTPTDVLFAELARIDSRRAETIDRHNRVRIIRALEIARELGKVPEVSPNLWCDPLFIGVKISPEVLQHNIHIRLLERFDMGMIDEVKRLHDEGVSWDRLHAFGLEYRYIALYLQGELSYQDMVLTLEREIHAFAKRQYTWLKRNKTIVWIEKNDTELLKSTIDNFIHR